jgi:hypothetical protein
VRRTRKPGGSGAYRPEDTRRARAWRVLTSIGRTELEIGSKQMNRRELSCVRFAALTKRGHDCCKLARRMTRFRRFDRSLISLFSGAISVVNHRS